MSNLTKSNAIFFEELIPYGWGQDNPTGGIDDNSTENPGLFKPHYSARGSMESLQKTLAMELKESGPNVSPPASRTFEISTDYFDESFCYNSINRPR